MPSWTICPLLLDIPPIKGVNPETDEEEERPSDDNEPFSALAFKIMTDPYVGTSELLPRVLRSPDRRFHRATTPPRTASERLGRILQMHANHREDIEEVYSGDIAAAVGLKNTTTGDTLCDEKHPDHPGVHGVPRARDPRGHRAQDQGRSGEDGHRPC